MCRSSKDVRADFRSKTASPAAAKKKADTLGYRLSFVTWWVTKESNLEPPD